MTERVSRLYKPTELVAASIALQNATDLTDDSTVRALKKLHRFGFRIVYVGKIDE